MTRAPTSSNLVPPAPGTARVQARVERLEFGKFCVDPDGPVERDRENVPIEHGQLGWSRGFPKELIGFCDPSIMGASTGELDPPPKDCPHGTVMRPVMPNGGDPRSVFYRVRTRPEAGEGQSGRRYIMARYMVEDEEDGVSPLALFDAMDGGETRLRGVTREEADALDALTVSVAEPVLGRVGEAFCRGALVYVLSGIPVSITEEVDEGEFFAWVTALRALLPSSLRVHLSAGWGVGDSFSGQLAVTHTAHRAQACAHFSPSGQVWTPPTYVTVWDDNRQPVQHNFFERRLEPGYSYLRFFFGSEDEWAVYPPPAFNQDALKLINSLPDSQFRDDLPDWYDPDTIKIFRRPGLKVRDEFTFLDIEDWLENNLYEDEVLPLLDVTRSMTYRSTRQKTLHLILKAMAKPDSIHRADTVLWAALSGRYPERFEPLVAEASGPWSARAQLMAALRRGDTLDALRLLLLAARKEAHDLHEEAVQSLHDCLDDSVERALNDRPTAATPEPNDGDYLAPHAELLRLKPPPAAYRDWLDQLGLRLMAAFASWRERFGEVPQDDILRISPSRDRDALYEMMFGVEDPQIHLARVSPLSEEQFRAFADVFVQEWERSDAARRQYLLGWFCALGVYDWLRRQGLLHYVHPLLLIYMNYPPMQGVGEPGPLPTGQQFIRVTEDVRSGRVPPALLTKVSAFCLEHLEELILAVPAQAKEEGQWRALAAMWPRPYATVFGLGNVTPADRVPEMVERAALNINISPATLNRLIAEQSLRLTFEDAQLYWNEAQKTPPNPNSPPQAAELCWYFEHGELPRQPPADPQADQNHFVRLASAAGKSEMLRANALRWWGEASKWWQMTLLLLLFPSEVFEPTPTQLGELIPYRDWLSRYLREHATSLREGNFYVATLPFHSLSYRYDQSNWRPGFNQSSIWAAFRGVPVSDLPENALYYALRSYSPGRADLVDDERRPMREDRARLCHTFLDSYLRGADGERSASFDPALRKVLYEFVLPELRVANTLDGAKRIFWDVEHALEDPYWEEREGMAQRHGPSFYGLLQMLFRNYGPGFLRDAIQSYYKRR